MYSLCVKDLFEDFFILIMFEMNVTEISHALQSLDYRYIFSNVIGPAQLELLVFTIGMLLYAVFVWFFYRNLSKRDLFKLDLSKYDFSEEKHGKGKKAFSIFLYLIKYGIVFPFYVAFWFAVLSIFLFVMAKEISVRQIALISIALVSTIRITSYLKEDLSHDLAKLMPLALLAIFLNDLNFFSWDLFITRFETMPSLGLELLQFLTFAVILEWTLRILYSLKIAASQKVTTKESQ